MCVRKCTVNKDTIMVRVKSRSLCKIREVEKMNFQAGFLKSARDYGS